MKINRVLALLLCVCGLLSGGGALGEEMSGTDALLLREGVALCERVGALAREEAFLEMMTSASLIEGESLQTLRGVNFSAPLGCAIGEAPAEAVFSMMGGATEWDVSSYAEMTPLLREELALRMPGALGRALISGNDTTQLVLSSVLTCGRAYEKPAGFGENRVLWLAYDEGVIGYVSFVVTGENIISGNAYFVFAPAGETSLEAVERVMPAQRFGFAAAQPRLSFALYDAGAVMEALAK